MCGYSGGGGTGRQGTGHSASSQGSSESRARALARQLEWRQDTAMEARGENNGMKMNGSPSLPLFISQLGN